jgi:hypothetical protein
VPRSASSRHHRRGSVVAAAHYGPPKEETVTVRLTKHEAHYLIGGLVTENDRMERARNGSVQRIEWDEDLHKRNEEVKEKLIRASRR